MENYIYNNVMLRVGMAATVHQGSKERKESQERMLVADQLYSFTCFSPTHLISVFSCELLEVWVQVQKFHSANFLLSGTHLICRVHVVPWEKKVHQEKRDLQENQASQE